MDPETQWEILDTRLAPETGGGGEDLSEKCDESRTQWDLTSAQEGEKHDGEVKANLSMNWKQPNIEFTFGSSQKYSNDSFLGLV